MGGAPATSTSPPLKEGPAGPKPRDLGTGALLASASLAISYVAIGITSIAAARIVGANGTGVVALSNQIVLITVFVAGIGLRTSVAAMVGAGHWSVRGAVHKIIPAAFALGVVGGVAGYGLYLLLQDSALRGFSDSMAIALMVCLPFALLWWIIAAVALGRERYEAYALITISAPATVMVFSPIGAFADGAAGAAYGLAAGYVVGGSICAAWALLLASRPESAEGGDQGLPRAISNGVRSWVNDLFQIVNLRPDLFILNAYSTTAATGIYSVSVSITSAGFILSQSLATVVLPRSAALRGLDTAESPVISERAAAAAVRHAVLVSLAAVAALAVILLFVPLVWGGDFKKAIHYGLILLPGVTMLGVGRVMVASFTGRGHPHYALAVGLLSFPATLVAYLLVIPDYGTTGAAVVTSLSYAAAALLAAVLFFRTIHTSRREALMPTRADVRDYENYARRLRSMRPSRS
ncbi:MAG: polysaccharide biosynthesis C-terminal domain-containing protein [Solirubrobacterales bacterium]